MMRILFGLLISFIFLSSSWNSIHGVSDEKKEKTNKFRERKSSDRGLGFTEMDEDSLFNTTCPRHVELRWKTEVSSSIYATPLIADINSDGKLEVVVSSFVHYLEVLEGTDGDKLPGWPAFHQSKAYSSPLLYDIDKDGTREIALATYNGIINFFRVSGYLMTDKLEVPRRKVPKNWYVGLHPDPVEVAHPDVHDDSPMQNGSDVDINGSTTVGSTGSAMKITNGSLINSTSIPTPGSSSSSTDASKLEGEGEGKGASAQAGKDGLPKNLDNTTIQDVSLGSVQADSASRTQRRLLQETDTNKDQEGSSGSHASADVESDTATVENTETLEEDADASFDIFRESEDLEDEYNYDSDDLVDENMWGDEDWMEGTHEKMEEFVNIDAHILCTPVIADIDNDGIHEMIVAVSYFFDYEYYEKPEHKMDLGGIDREKYVASGIVVFNLDTKQVKWTADLELSIESGPYLSTIYSSPIVVDLDGDRNLDILVGTSFGLVYAFDHHGKVRDHFPLEMAEIQAPVIAADINDDGNIEILTADVHGNIAAWSAQGDEIWEMHLKSPIPMGPTIGDVDGDGHTDVVVSTLSGNIYVLSGRDGSLVGPFPYRTYGRLMSPVLLVDLSKQDEKAKGLTLVTTAFDGYMYLIDGSTACVDVVDIGETSYSMVLADNVDGGDDLDLIVTTMNGNVFCFQTPSPHYPLKERKSYNQGRNNAASQYDREGIYVSHASRSFRDEEGKHFWVEIEIIDKYRVPSGHQGPYNVTTTLLVPANYQGERRIVVSEVYNQPGKVWIKLPTIPVRSMATVLVEMVDKNGLYFSDEFSLTFHLHYYKILKWLLVLPMLAMFSVFVILAPQEASPLPSFSRNAD